VPAAFLYSLGFGLLPACADTLTDIKAKGALTAGVKADYLPYGSITKLYDRAHLRRPKFKGDSFLSEVGIAVVDAVHARLDMADDEFADNRSDTIVQIVKFIRFSILATLGLAFFLLVVDVLSGGARTPDWRFLSERVLIALVLAMASEVAVGIAAVTCIALWPHQATGGSTQSGSL
jgi:hypothetical protein